MEKINLSVEDILNKEFKVGFEGYSAADVDSYLDIVLEDYQIYEENIEELNKTISDLKETIESLKSKCRELESNQKVIDFSNTTTYSSVDLLKRVSRLEEEVYKNNK